MVAHLNYTDTDTCSSRGRNQLCKLYRKRLSPYCTWLLTSRLDMTRHVRLVKPMHIRCVELVKLHGWTRSHDELDSLDTSNVSRRVET